MRFSHFDNEFPYPETIDPYKHDVSFDYSQYDKTQMRITVCSVPWDVGLIHVGNAQIGGLGNVVHFETKEARDEWFDSIEDKFVWDTEYREYHGGGHMKIPLPYEKAVLYNYVFVEYTRLPVDYSEGGKDRFFFFIRSCSSDAPSTCDLELLRDTFQTYIYDVDVSYLMLERGHAPMTLTTVTEYLVNPVERNSYLLAEDVNFGDSYVRTNTKADTLNSGIMWAVIVSSGTPEGDWGRKNSGSWKVPSAQAFQDGQPSMHAIVVAPERLGEFLRKANATMPQYLQTVKGVFFIERRFLDLKDPFTLLDEQCYRASPNNNSEHIIDFAKDQFGYDERYADLVKLYTYPYAFFEISDEKGNVCQVRIEDTEGDISLKLTASIAYPWIRLDGRLSGIGTGGGSVTFRNVDEHVFEFSGDWYHHLYSWNIPVFAVTQSPSTEYDYSTHFDREQKALENTTAMVNANASAVTAKANADRSANAAKTNADDSAETAKTNADSIANTASANAVDSADTEQSNSNATSSTAKTNADNSTKTDKSNADNLAAITYGNAKRDADAGRSKFAIERKLAQDHIELLTQGEVSPGSDLYGYMGQCAQENINKISDDWTSDWTLANITNQISNTNTAATSVTNGVGSAVSAVIGGAATGMAAGPGGAAIGAVTGLVGASVSLATTSASIPITIGANNDMLNAQLECGEDKTDHAIVYARNMARYQREFEVSKYGAENLRLTDAANLVQTTLTDDAKASLAGDTKRAKDSNETNLANNLRTYNTSVSNAGATHETSTRNAERTRVTEIDNNQRTKNTAIANAQRTYSAAMASNAATYDTAIAIATRNKETSDEAIANAIRQAGLRAPSEFGEFANGETSTTRPMAIFSSIVTQSKDAIEQTGDYFLRYGYAVNRAWKFESFNVMPRFTYWKASDMWISGNNVPDAYLDELRFFFLGGVTVWRRPEYIGNTSIYENV